MMRTRIIAAAAALTLAVGVSACSVDEEPQDDQITEEEAPQDDTGDEDAGDEDTEDES